MKSPQCRGHRADGQYFFFVKAANSPYFFHFSCQHFLGFSLFLLFRSMLVLHCRFCRCGGDVGKCGVRWRMRVLACLYWVPQVFLDPTFVSKVGSGVGLEAEPQRGVGWGGPLCQSAAAAMHAGVKKKGGNHDCTNRKRISGGTERRALSLARVRKGW